MISIQITGNPAAQLRKMAASLGDTATPNRQIATQLYGWVIRNFQAEGGLGEQPWAPLAASTAMKRVTKRGALRGYHPILQVTGALRSSFLPFSDATEAGIGAGVPYSQYLQQGTRRMPARPMLPTRQGALDIATDVYGMRIRQIRDEASLSA